MTKTGSRAFFTALALLVCAALPAQQAPPNLILTATTTPIGFGSPASTPSCGGLINQGVTNVVASEQLFVTLTSTPSPVVPTPLLLRRVALAIGIRNCASQVSVNGVPILIDLSLPFFVPLDSFSHPTDPHFGAPFAGPSVINTVVRTDSYFPIPAFPLHLVLQAITEDLPGGSGLPIVSNPFEVTIVDPAAAGFVPTITNVSAEQGGCGPNPSGPETGGTLITITGTNFPVQSDWFFHPPTVEVGSLPATEVVIHSQTMVTARTPSVASPVPLCPPQTNAGPHEVKFRNSMDLSPTGVFAVSSTKFTYCSGLTPVIGSLTAPMLTPEGGALTIAGSNFLYGADVTFSSVASPSLTATVSPDDPMITGSGTPPCPSGGATSIMLTAPPFCAGPVSVRVFNPDGVASAVQTLAYPTLDPGITQVTPTVTVTGLPGTSTFPAMTTTGSSLTITGSHFIPPTSPLFGASTVPQAPSMLFPTKVELVDQGGAVIPFTSATTTISQGSISLTASIETQTGPFRPKLGLKTLSMTNPPCVSSGTPASTTILVRDPLPPTAAGLFPNVVAQSTGGVNSTVEITGSNFFSNNQPTALPFAHPFPAPPTLADLVVPAVAFGSYFSPQVTLVSETKLIAEIPAGLPMTSSTVTVYNPDGRSSTANGVLYFVPRLTDATALTESSIPVLTEGTLTYVATVNPFLFGTKSIIFAPNPTANDDRLEDIANGGDPAITGDPSAYDAAFFFNTRDMSGAMRCFDFNAIDVPATFVLPTPLPTSGPVIIPAGIKRVIFKATSFDPDFTVSPPNAVLFLQQNFPLVLRSHGAFNFGGVIDLTGDSLVNQGVASSPALKFVYRCQWQVPPAGGGLGGRGGVHYSSNLTNLATVTGNPLILPTPPAFLPQPTLGAGATVYNGADGLRPLERFPAAPTATYGHKGLGVSPIGLQGGGGGGGGFSPTPPPATGGQIGNTTTAGAPGLTFGGFTNAPPGTAGRPPNGFDQYIYGASPADFNGPLGSSTAFPKDFFMGGSGGGGGGGSSAIVIPCVSMGGRGGNGGGGVVLLSDSTFKLGQYGRVYVDGEKGLLGLDAFPFPNGEPLFVLCAPGSGGGGSGGLIFIAAVADVDLTEAAMGASPGQHILSAAGGPGGAPTGPTTVQTANGGHGGTGRIRIAMNPLSSMVSLRASDMMTLSSAANQNIVPDLGALINPAFVSYP